MFSLFFFDFVTAVVDVVVAHFVLFLVACSGVGCFCICTFGKDVTAAAEERKGGE